jgi:hypothetical protein
LLDAIGANGDWPSPYPWKNFYASCRSRTVSAKKKAPFATMAKVPEGEPVTMVCHWRVVDPSKGQVTNVEAKSLERTHLPAPNPMVSKGSHEGIEMET